jgi:hypothetical protein
LAKLICWLGVQYLEWMPAQAAEALMMYGIMLAAVSTCICQ